MTTPTSEVPILAPRWKPLDASQRRVLGVLIEKAKTTPAGYPMTVKAIVAGCNQKNNRDPVSTYDDFDVEKALSELQELGVVKEIDWVGRVPKYKHLAYEWLGVKPVELAVLAELLLRGAQALGDLRARAARMEPIEDLGTLKPIVDGLLERKLMIELTPPGRGQIVSHNLYTSSELDALRAQYGRHAERQTSHMERPDRKPVERIVRADVGPEAWEPCTTSNGRTIGMAKWLRRGTGGEWSHTAMVWSCEPMTFDYEFPGDESFVVIAGRVRIEVKDSQQIIELGPGDVASFSKGTPSVWTVLEPIVKFTVVSG